MVALDLFVALLTSDIPNRDAIVLAEIIVQSYGPTKRRNVHIDPATQEDITGQHRNNVRAALRSLTEANIIARNDDGTYRFLKDWERYRPAGRPFTDRLGGGLATFARNVKSRFGRIKQSKEDAIQLDSNAIQPDSGQTIVSNPTELTPTTVGDSNWIGPNTDTNGLVDDVNHETRMTYNPSLACAGTHAELDKKTLEVVVADAGERPKRPFSPDPDDVTRVQNWANEACGELEEIASKVKQFSTVYPLDWIEAAILCGLTGSATGSVWKYAHKCLLSWWAKGRPDHEEVAVAQEKFPLARLAPRPAPTAREDKRRRADAAMNAAIPFLPDL